MNTWFQDLEDAQLVSLGTCLDGLEDIAVLSPPDLAHNFVVVHLLAGYGELNLRGTSKSSYSKYLGPRRRAASINAPRPSPCLIPL